MNSIRQLTKLLLITGYTISPQLDTNHNIRIKNAIYTKPKPKNGLKKSTNFKFLIIEQKFISKFSVKSSESEIRTNTCKYEKNHRRVFSLTKACLKNKRILQDSNNIQEEYKKLKELKQKKEKSSSEAQIHNSDSNPAENCEKPSCKRPFYGTILSYPTVPSGKYFFYQKDKKCSQLVIFELKELSQNLKKFLTKENISNFFKIESDFLFNYKTIFSFSPILNTIKICFRFDQDLPGLHKFIVKAAWRRMPPSKNLQLSSELQEYLATLNSSTIYLRVYKYLPEEDFLIAETLYENLYIIKLVQICMIFFIYLFSLYFNILLQNFTLSTLLLIEASDSLIQDPFYTTYIQATKLCAQRSLFPSQARELG